MAKMTRFLHPNHHACVDIKFSLAQLYGRARASDVRLIHEGRRKQMICIEILEVMSRVCPGMFRLRGMFLFELYVVSLFLLKKDAEEGEGSDLRLRLARLEGLRRDLVEAVEILSWEPPGSAEGRRCAVAREYLKSLEVMVDGCKGALASSAADGGKRERGRKKTK